MNYILCFIIINILNIIIYWNEVIVLLLQPLENLILKNNTKVIYYFLSDHYRLEDNNSSSIIDLEGLNIYNNEIPYFEINISTLNSTDWLFGIVAGFLLLLLVLPFFLYQATLFVSPILLKHELRMVKKRVLAYTCSSIFIFLITSTTILDFLIKSYLVATQEIGYYEFEIELDIIDYLSYYLSIITIQNVILFLFLTLKNKKSCNSAILVSIFLLVSLFSWTLAIWAYYISVIMLLEIIKKILSVSYFLKYKHCVRMNGNSKLYSLLF